MNHIELRNKVIDYYDHQPMSPELRCLIDDLKNTTNWYKIIFNCKGIDDFLAEDIIVELVPGGELIDVYPKTCPQFKLRLPATNAAEIDDCIEYMRLLMIEQSIHSPHRYRNIMDDVSVIDVGASEGIFGYMYCNSTHELHMFDDTNWRTCAIHNVRVGGLTNAYYYGYLNMDFIGNIKLTKPLGCIKIDVDGPEIDMLNTLEDLINQYHPMIQVATYHYAEEASEVTDWLVAHGYDNVEPSQGWMLYPQDDTQVVPYFRTGLVIAEKYNGI